MRKLLKIESEQYLESVTECVVKGSINASDFPLDELISKKEYKNFLKEKHLGIGFDSITFSVSAIAKKNPKDKYDKELGKRIAKSRAYTKIYKLHAQIIKKSLSIIEKRLRDLQETLETLNYKEEREKEHLFKLIEPLILQEDEIRDR